MNQFKTLNLDLMSQFPLISLEKLIQEAWSLFLNNLVQNLGLNLK